MSEGKAWINKTNADAAAEWRDNRKEFRGLQWFYDRDYVLRSVVDRYVSVVRSDSWFDGGAHPNQHADTILWDDVAHKRTNIRALFTETADNGPTMTALARAAMLAVATAKLANDINGYGDDDRPEAKDMTPEREIEHDSFIKDGRQAGGSGDWSHYTCALNRNRQDVRFDISLFALRRRPLCGGTLYRVCSMDRVSAIFVAAGHCALGGERPKGDKEKW